MRPTDRKLECVFCFSLVHALLCELKFHVASLKNLAEKILRAGGTFSKQFFYEQKKLLLKNYYSILVDYYRRHFFWMEHIFFSSFFFSTIFFSFCHAVVDRACVGGCRLVACFFGIQMELPVSYRQEKLRTTKTSNFFFLIRNAEWSLD